MAVNSVNFNWMQTTNAAGSFSIISDGYVQGVMMDDPSSRFWLESGLLASTETFPLFGGVLISTTVVGGSPQTDDGQDSLGPTIARATTVAAAMGFAVFNQSHNWVNTPQSPVPVGLTGTTGNFVRFGTNSRIPLAIDPEFAQTLVGGASNQQVSWDFVGQQVVPFTAATAEIAITSLTWSAGVVTVVTATAHPFVVGDVVPVVGAVPFGYNGSQVVTTVADDTHFTYSLATNPGTETTPGFIPATGGALPCVLLDINIGNSKTVVWDPINQQATWNNEGSTIVVRI